MADLIFLIEDEKNIRDFVTCALQSSKYEIEGFECAEDALERMKKVKPDLCIFDVMLPGMEGTEAVKLIRQTDKKIPIIILTAKDSELDKVVGLDCGADDYMTKPFGILELLARIRALLRRSSNENDTEIKTLNIGSLVIDVPAHEIRVDGRKVELTNKEFELLRYLVEHKDRVVERDELLNNIWGYDFSGETRTLDIHIRTLRKKLDTDCIKTVRGVGYRYVEEK